MRLDRNPLYRKIMVPWWDSEIPCLILILAMVFVFLFGLVGIAAAYATIQYRSFIWVPVLVAMLSAAVILSTAVRLVRRRLALHGNSH